MSRFLALAIPVASSCAYTPSSFSAYQQSFPGPRTTVGCLDVAAGLTDDIVQVGPVIQYTIGNRCDHETIVDFSAVRAQSADSGLGPQMFAYDPRGELRPLAMEARSVITERIEYRRVITSGGHGICVDVGRLDGRSGSERWLCQDEPTLAGVP